MELSLLSLPGELRNHIFYYLLPEERAITYKCPPGYHDQYKPAHPSCGNGPGWLCEARRDCGAHNMILANHQLYAEYTGLLYNRVFILEITDQIFFIDTCDREKISKFPFPKARWVAIEVDVPTNSKSVQTRLENIAFTISLCAQYSPNILYISFIIQAIEAKLLKSLTAAFGISSSDHEQLLAFGEMHNIAYNAFTAHRIFLDSKAE
jgi:hypothetical protein